jgi:hypothetical protein
MKISQMIFDFASDFIELGTTLEEKQSHLNVACIAWNISILPTNIRKQALAHFLVEYKKNNPTENEDNIRNIKSDMELLIKEKIIRFPSATKPIEHAKITENDTEYRITIISSTERNQSVTSDNPDQSDITKHYRPII